MSEFNFTDLVKGLPNWHEKYNDDFRAAFAELANKVNKDKAITWYEPSFLGNYVNINVRYAKTENGLVFINGRFQKPDANPLPGDDILMLPEGFRPNRTTDTHINSNVATWSVFCHILTDGIVRFAASIPAPSQRGFYAIDACCLVI